MPVPPETSRRRQIPISAGGSERTEAGTGAAPEPTGAQPGAKGSGPASIGSSTPSEEQGRNAHPRLTQAHGARRLAPPAHLPPYPPAGGCGSCMVGAAFGDRLRDLAVRGPPPSGAPATRDGTAPCSPSRSRSPAIRRWRWRGSRSWARARAVIGATVTGARRRRTIRTRRRIATGTWASRPRCSPGCARRPRSTLRWRTVHRHVPVKVMVVTTVEWASGRRWGQA